jgi:hypothetical protein
MPDFSLSEHFALFISQTFVDRRALFSVSTAYTARHFCTDKIRHFRKRVSIPQVIGLLLSEQPQQKPQCKKNVIALAGVYVFVGTVLLRCKIRNRRDIPWSFLNILRQKGRMFCRQLV